MHGVLFNILYCCRLYKLFIILKAVAKINRICLKKIIVVIETVKVIKFIINLFVKFVHAII
jgi:hypothetical protein